MDWMVPMLFFVVWLGLIVYMIVLATRLVNAVGTDRAVAHPSGAAGLVQAGMNTGEPLALRAVGEPRRSPDVG